MRNFFQRSAICAALCIVAVATSCVTSLSGESKTDNRNVSGFTSIELSVSADVLVSQGSEFNLTIEGDKSLVDRIETVVSDGVLVIKSEGWSGLSWGDSKIIINVTMPQIEGLAVSGSGDIKAMNAIVCTNLEARVTGSGDIILENLTVKELKANVSGSGDINVSGEKTAGSIYAKVTGSGDIAANGIAFTSAEATVSGSGDIFLCASESLKAKVVGSGDIVYSGNPLVDAKVTGSGRIRGN